MKIKIVSIVVLLLFISTPMIIFAQGTAEIRQDKPKMKLSDALFYQQLSQQPTNSQSQSNVVLTSRKNPWVAGVMSFLVPGLGQFYNKEYTKGTIHFATVVCGYTLFLLAVEDDVIHYNYTSFSGGSQASREMVDVDGDNGVGGVGLLVAFGTSVWSIIDAPISANRINRQNESIYLSAAPLMKPNRTGAVLTFRW